MVLYFYSQIDNKRLILSNILKGGSYENKNLLLHRAPSERVSV